MMACSISETYRTCPQINPATLSGLAISFAPACKRQFNQIQSSCVSCQIFSQIKGVKKICVKEAKSLNAGNSELGNGTNELVIGTFS